MSELLLNTKYELVCGLEVHIQLNTKSKAFCSDLNEYGSIPNTNIGVISLGHPGTLPRLNKRSIDSAILLGLATNSTVANEIFFARKNYFYADLPKGYQITQDKTPICTCGMIIVKKKDGTEKKINLTRIHMEEDAGKSIHDQDPFNTLVDLNRAGVPLLEIVSEPEISDADEAYSYLSEVRKLVRYLNICDGNMEEGSMRCDANVSVRLKGAKELGQRTEVKNMNSLRNVQRAIDYEAQRQIELLEKGEKIEMQTRSFDAVNGTTFALRSKELAHDYRYFPEPDLPVFRITVNQIQEIKKRLPPLPKELFKKYTADYNLSEYDANILTESKEIALYFEEVIKHTNNYKAAANWVMGDVKSYLNQQAAHISEFPLQGNAIANLINLIDEGKVSNSVASQNIFPEMLKQPQSAPIKIAESLNLLQNSNIDSIKDLARQALLRYPEKVEAYKNGNKGLLGLFMSEVMKLSNRKADPKAASRILKELLDQ